MEAERASAPAMWQLADSHSGCPPAFWTVAWLARFGGLVGSHTRMPSALA
jgi:hypothetical protein